MNTDCLSLSSDLSAFVADRISSFGAECDDTHRWLIPYVEKFSILPLFLGWTETIGLLPDGRVRKFSADGECVEYEGLKLVDDVFLFLAALTTGAKRYPELKTLIPRRPANAVTCQTCHGTGQEIPGSVGTLVCVCGGLGWTCVDAV